MKGNITDQGYFELFSSERSHWLLILDEERKFRWEWDAAMPKLLITDGVVDASGDKDYKTLRRGRYCILLGSDGDRIGFNFLLLESENSFDVYRLFPQLPDLINTESEIINMNEKMSAEEVDILSYKVGEL